MFIVYVQIPPTPQITSIHGTVPLYSMMVISHFVVGGPYQGKEESGLCHVAREASLDCGLPAGSAPGI